MVRKYVITGAPGSGKSPLIKALQLKGEATMDVVGDYINHKKSEGVVRPWKDPGFENSIRHWQFTKENDVEKIAKNGRVFINRGIIDGLAYSYLKGHSNAMLNAGRIMQQIVPYDLVFLLKHDDNNFKKDEECFASDVNVEKSLEQHYVDAQYEPIIIPSWELEKRVEIVQEYVRIHEKKT